MSVTSGEATPPRLKSKAKYKASWNEVKHAAYGQWPQILKALIVGINHDCLSGKPGFPCPACGGEDRFQFTDDNRGCYICRKCADTSKGFPDGFNLIAACRGISNNDAKDLVAEYLGLSKPNKPNKANPCLPGKKSLTPKTLNPLDQAQQESVEPALNEQAKQIIANCKQGLPKYLARKGITTTHHWVNTRKITLPSGMYIPKDAWILPIHDINNPNEHISIQYINPTKDKHDRDKFHLKGFKKRNGIQVIATNKEAAYLAIGTGAATTLSFSMAIDCTAIATFDDKELVNKCVDVTRLYPDKKVLIIGDNDSHKGHTQGQDAARKAAKLTNGLAIIPPEAGDWNDYHKMHGLNAAKIEIKRQLLDTKKAIKELEMNTNVDTIKKDAEQTLQIGFVLEKHTLVFHKPHNDGTTTPIPVSSRIEITAKQSDLYTGGNTGLTLKFKNIFNKEMIWSMPRSLLAEDKTITAALCGLGAVIYDKRLFNRYLMQANPEQELFCVDRIGWHHMDGHRFFILPDKTIGYHENKEKLVYQSNELNTLFHTSGTIDQWRENVSKLCTGNSRPMFAISHAFASMLLEPTGSTNGGINFFGESSTGKTTIAKICGSIFSDVNYTESCRTTTNALENTAHSHNDCLLILDEISQFNEKEMGDAVYTLGNGMGKGRMKSETDARKIKKFRNNFIFTGEISVAQHTNEGGKKETEGQGIRVLDIPAVVSEHGVFDALHGFNSGAELSKYLIEQCSKYYGTAFIQFLTELTKPGVTNKLDNKMREIKTVIMNELSEKPEGQADRVLDRFVLAAIAGELATEWKITGWTSGEAIKAASECFKSWLNQRGGVKNQETIKVLKQMKEFLEAHGESRFTEITYSNPTDSKTINRAGFRKKDNGEWVYYVLSGGFKEMHKTFTKNVAIKSLIDAGWLVPAINSNGHYEANRAQNITGHGTHRVYEIRLINL